MCHSRDLNHRINKLHERALRVVYNNNDLTFEQLLEEDGSFTVHEKNLQKLATEMYNSETQPLFKTCTGTIHSSNTRTP